MTKHKSFGALTPEQFRAVADAKMVGAASIGILPTWMVTFSRVVEQVGFASVEANSEEDAMEIAADLPRRKIKWMGVRDDDPADVFIDGAEEAE